MVHGKGPRDTAARGLQQPVAQEVWAGLDPQTWRGGTMYQVCQWGYKKGSQPGRNPFQPSAAVSHTSFALFSCVLWHFFAVLVWFICSVTYVVTTLGGGLWVLGWVHAEGMIGGHLHVLGGNRIPSQEQGWGTRTVPAWVG